MAAVDEMRTERLASASTQADAKRIINEIFWTWFAMNQNRKLVKVKWFFVSKTIYVRDIEDIFVLLVGPRPSFLAT